MSFQSMLTFKQYIQERFINFLPKDIEKKREHASAVHGMLQKSYESQGGLHGSGFGSPEEMTHKIPMWKVHKSGGAIRAAAMYKDKEGRKRVAIGTDGSEEGKKAAAHIMLHDLHQGRSYGETSGRSLSFMKKHIPNFHSHVKDYAAAAAIAGKDGEEIRKPPETDAEVQRHPEFANHFYQRKIGDELHTKLMVGTPGKTIK